jgi:NAD(P)-dependent dehydrogenase (short-subunit alcohol dehydrogenase family)
MKNGVALVFAAGGAVGGAVARRLAQDGFTLHLSGRSGGPVESLATELGAPSDVVDATDEAAVSAWVDQIASERGRIDVVFNAIGLRCAEGGYALPSPTIPFAQFLLPLQVITGSHFLTARAAARHMIRQRAGAIVTLSASLTRVYVPCMAGITAAHAAIEGMTLSLAAELGPYGVRVNCVRAAGMPGTRTIQETNAQMRRTLGAPADAAAPAAGNALRRSVTPRDVAEMVAHLASERAAAVSGQVVNVCAGELV